MTTADVRRKRSRLRRWRRKAAPFLPWVAGLSVALLVVFGYLAATALSSAQHASSATSSLSRVETDLRTGSWSAARSDAERAAIASHAAKADASGMIFRLAAHVPVLGRPLQSLQSTSDVLDDVAREVVRPVVNSSGVRLENAVHGTSFDVTSIKSAAPVLAAASSRLDADVRKLSGVRGVGIRSLDSRLMQGRRKLQSAAGLLRLVSSTAQVTPPMLSDGRRYLVLVQNNAESRATGGLIGAYALLQVSGQHLQLLAAGPNNDLHDVRTPVMSLDRASEERYQGLGVTTTWRSLNLTPDFPTAASIAARLWSATGHGHVDGVLAVDPVALAKLLRVTGSVAVPGGPTLNGSNAVAYLESGVYSRYPRAADAERNRYLAAVTRAVFSAVSGRHIDGKRLLRALGTSVEGRHVQVWSAHPAEQSILAKFAVAGALPHTAGPFLEVVTQNLTGGKVDYYLRRRVSYVSHTAGTLDDVGSGPVAMDDAVATVTLTNTAPDHGLAPYVTVRADLPRGAHSQPGADRLWLSLYLARGTGYVRATMDDHVVALHTDEDAAATVLSTVVDLAPGESQTLTVHLLQPAPDGSDFQYVPQPLAVPDTVDIRRT